MAEDQPPVETREGPPEDEESIAILVVAPAAWALHLLASYITAAIWCEKRADEAGLGVWLAVYTVLALVAVGWGGLRGLRRHRLGVGLLPHHMDTPADRHRFLGFSTLLLAGVSALAIGFVTAALVLVDTCQ